MRSHFPNSRWLVSLDSSHPTKRVSSIVIFTPFQEGVCRSVLSMEQVLPTLSFKMPIRMDLDTHVFSGIPIGFRLLVQLRDGFNLHLQVYGNSMRFLIWLLE